MTRWISLCRRVVSFISRHGRDDNTLTWEAQDEAAARKVGTTIAGMAIAGTTSGDAQSEELSPADWMRIYFGHARAVQRTVTQLLERNS